MRRIALVVSSVVILGGLTAVVGYNNALMRLGSSGDGEGPEPSRCISDATITLSVSPATVTYPQSTTVTWNVDVPSGCSTLRVKLNADAVAMSGSRSLVPPRSALYRLLVSETRGGVYAELSESVNVSVNYPPRVVIGPNIQHPVAVLLGALGSSNEQQTVELCDVDLDLTGTKEVEIRSNRTLIGSPACARGPRNLGPRIFITDERGRAALFEVRGDNVRISGFRLEGPTSYMAQGDRKEKGILISPPDGAEPIRNIEISNMEIFHWSGVGIQVVDNIRPAQRGRLFNTNPGAVRVKGNFFHHNRHGAGEGYGVASTSGAYITIEQNVFDENRHAIAGGSKHKDGNDYSGYTARDNLILSGGGLHCADSTGTGAGIGGVIGGIVGGVIGGLVGGLPGAIVGAGIGAGVGAGAGAVAGSWCWQTHQVDMHGDDNRFYGEHNWQCGTAGETILIERNTILYTKGHAIKIRGNPADKAVADGNVFKDGSHSHAISQNGYCGYGDNITKPIDVRPNNVFGLDPTIELGSCDFFGDGRQDQFMATGVTWWAKSPVTGQWRYLNTMPEKLPQLQLGRVDGDAICDVALRTPRPEISPEKYSKSGTGPWRSRTVISR